MRIDKQNILIVLVIISLVIGGIGLTKTSAVPENKKSTFDKIMESKELGVCYVPWPPSLIKDPNTGELSGFLIEVIEEIAAESNLKIEYVQSTWAGFPADLNTGKCDAAIAGLYPTIGRSTGVSFTRPFFYSGNSAVVRKDETRFNKISDLNNKDVKISVIQGDFDHIYAKRYLPKAELVVLDKSSDITMSLVAVSSGKSDVGLSTSDTVSAYVKTHPEIKALFLDKPYSTKPVTWAVRHKDQQLLNFLNNGLEYLEATGFLGSTIRKYNPDGWYSIERDYLEYQ